jgi:hypothetical protein
LFDNKGVEAQILTPAIVGIHPQHSTQNLGWGGRNDLNRKFVEPAMINEVFSPAFIGSVTA